MQVKPGARLRSSVDSTEVVVVKAPAGAVDLRCGGHPMATPEEDVSPGGDMTSGFDAGSLLGKRYADEELGLEVLCTKAGPGSLSIADALMPIKGAKPLPSSD